MASLKSQFKKADASGARYALVFGQDELLQNQVTIKDLRDASKEQRSVALEDLSLWAKGLQSAT
jgi:histidyl-tRNA synthetase